MNSNDHAAIQQRTVLVRFDRVYGQIKCYPVNEQAQTLTRIARTKTLSPDNLRDAARLGLEVLLEHNSWAVLDQFLGDVS